MAANTVTHHKYREFKISIIYFQFKGGLIEGVLWEPNGDLMDPLKESITFSIDGSKVPAKCLCIPSMFPHECSLNIDKVSNVL